MQWDVKSADMKYLATMAKNEGVPLTQKKKRSDKQSVLWENVFAVVLVSIMKKIIDLHVTDLATHLNLFDWLLNHAFQRELYVELRCTAVQRI